MAPREWHWDIFYDMQKTNTVIYMSRVAIKILTCTSFKTFNDLYPVRKIYGAKGMV